MEQSRILVDMALKAWYQQVSRAEKFFDAQSDEGLEKEVAPGRNRIAYLYAHLTASNDGMMTLFGFGPRLYPSFEDIFSKNPDRALPHPPASEIRKAWKETHQALAKGFEKLSVNDWLDKHTAMTAEDLAKEPTRNKLSVLISRTNHIAYHMGQLVLVKGS
ncbi:MAG TPA: DinB family protein [Cyclobacteriaceae bacterium]|nr:DinB family protein [Cyclobacteriaceae bacterium]